MFQFHCLLFSSDHSILFSFKISSLFCPFLFVYGMAFFFLSFFFYQFFPLFFLLNYNLYYRYHDAGPCYSSLAHIRGVRPSTYSVFKLIFLYIKQLPIYVTGTVCLLSEIHGEGCFILCLQFMYVGELPSGLLFFHLRF